MTKGTCSTWFYKYPKLTCLCVIYTVSCFIFMVQSPPDQYAKGLNSLNKYSGKFSSKLIKEQNRKVTGRETNIRGKLPLGFYNQSSTSIKDGKNNTTLIDVQCNMTKYLSLNSQFCDAILNKANNSVLSSIIKGKNSILKESNRQALQALAGSMAVFKDVFKAREDNCNLGKVDTNCNWLKASYLYAKHSVTTEEELFPLAFAMKIHKGGNQAHRLLRYVYREHNVYCIHIDKKADNEIYAQFKRIEACFDNVVVIDDRVNVVYSTIRQVEAELKCMTAVTKRKEAWRYYINLTGQEFMLKTNIGIVRILRLMNGTNDIESYPVPRTEFHKIKQRTVIMNDSPVVTRQKKPDFKSNIKIHKGSAYGLFSREFVNFVLKDKFVSDFLEWLKDAYAPEELIWATLQTLPGTPGGRANVAQVGGKRAYISRAVKWKMDETVTCHGKHVHWICIYGLEDVPWLLSNPNIVANKFYEDYEPLALDCVEKAMYNRLVKNAGKTDLLNIYGYKKLLNL